MNSVENFEMPAKYKMLLDDKDLCEKVGSAESAEGISKAFAEKGIEMDEAIAQECFKELKKVSTGELSEKELEDVAGGWIIGAVVMGAVGAVGGYVVTFGTAKICGLSTKEAHREALKGAAVLGAGWATAGAIIPG